METISSIIKTITLGTLLFILFDGVWGSTHNICNSRIPCSCGFEIENSKQFSQLDTFNQCIWDGVNIENRDNIVLDCYETNFNSNTKFGTAINIINSSNVTIKNCNVEGFNNGIKITNSNFISIINSNISNNGVGVSLLNSNNNLIRDSILNNNSWDGIFLENSNDNVISNNTIQYNIIDGIQIFHGSKNNLVTNNDLRFNYGHAIAPISCNNEIDETNIGGDGNPIYYRENNDLLKIDSNDIEYSEIILCNISRFTIRDIEIKNSLLEKGDGVLILHSDSGKIMDSSFENVRTGVYLFNSSNIVIENSNFKNNNYGIRLYEKSNGVIISKNDFTDNDFVLDVINSKTSRALNLLILGNNYNVQINSENASIITQNQSLELKGDVDLTMRSRNIVGTIQNNWKPILIGLVSILSFLLIFYLVIDYIKFKQKYD